MFFKKKKNDVMDFVKEADKKIAYAYRTNEVRELKDIVTFDMFKNLRTDIAAHKSYDVDKYEDEAFMERTYSVVEENDEVAVIKRDITFKVLKTFSKRFVMGLDFSEIITVNKTNGYVITGIAAA